MRVCVHVCLCVFANVQFLLKVVGLCLFLVTCSLLVFLLALFMFALVHLVCVFVCAIDCLVFWAVRRSRERRMGGRGWEEEGWFLTVPMWKTRRHGDLGWVPRHLDGAGCSCTC